MTVKVRVADRCNLAVSQSPLSLKSMKCSERDRLAEALGVGLDYHQWTLKIQADLLQSGSAAEPSDFRVVIESAQARHKEVMKGLPAAPLRAPLRAGPSRPGAGRRAASRNTPPPPERDDYASTAARK
jgi:hypothetical protein